MVALDEEGLAGWEARRQAGVARQEKPALPPRPPPQSGIAAPPAGPRGSERSTELRLTKGALHTTRMKPDSVLIASSATRGVAQVGGGWASAPPCGASQFR